ncbi:MAG TPA: hypothetical protein VNC50_17725 [Planctomycetia bacterium]|nr:hypothetical protein [Planctomycetia bacterium]
MRRLALLTWTFTLITLARAEERHYVVFFAHECDRGHKQQSHSYAEFIRSEIREGAAPVILQRDAISWLPADGRVRFLAARPEPGRNCSLDETLVLACGKHVYAWGPYELSSQAYQLALLQRARLESGAVWYKAIDVVPGQKRHAANCVHALAEVDPCARRQGQYNFKCGERATLQVIRHYGRCGFLCDPCRTHDAVWCALGLDGRGIARQSCESKVSN